MASCSDGCTVGEGSQLIKRDRAFPRMRMLSLIGVLFFNVSGGPAGSEEIIQNGGPILGGCAIAIFMLFFSVPQALLTAELTTAFPENGGYVIWVHAAYGQFWSVQQSFWQWTSGVVDSALYPVLAYSTVASLLSPALGSAAVSGACADNPNYDPDDDTGRNLWGCLFTEADSCSSGMHPPVASSPSHATSPQASPIPPHAQSTRSS